MVYRTYEEDTTQPSPGKKAKVMAEFGQTFPLSKKYHTVTIKCSVELECTDDTIKETFDKAWQIASDEVIAQSDYVVTQDGVACEDQGE